MWNARCPHRNSRILQMIEPAIQLRCHFLVFYFILYWHISIASFTCFVSSSPFERGPGSANTMGHCEDVLTKANEPFDIWRDEHLAWVPNMDLTKWGTNLKVAQLLMCLQMSAIKHKTSIVYTASLYVIYKSQDVSMFIHNISTHRS